MIGYISLLLFIGLAFWSCGEQEPEQSDINEGGYITIELPDCPPLEDINEENLCTADDGTDGVKILGECYSIENTTEITFGDAFASKPSGPLPKEIALLTNLIIFNGSNYWGGTTDSKFTGEIPTEICNLTNLINLNLSYNALTGSIPPEIGHLTKLHKLSFGRNELTGEIPSTVGNLVELRNLSSSNNNHSGRIPQEIGNLTKLHTLNFSYNELTGPIPSNIGNLKNLGLWDPEYYNVDFDTEIWIAFNLSHNNLTGPLPASIGDLDELGYVDFSYNQIDGPIPPEMGDMEFLVEMNLLNNQLNGEIPPELGNLSSLAKLWLADNNLRGVIPEELCNVDVCRTQTYECNSTANVFSRNNFCPPYPQCFVEFETIGWTIDIVNYQNCNPYPDCADGYTAINDPPPINGGDIYDGWCFYQSDLDVLQDFIDVNESLSGEPLEIGIQRWYGGEYGNGRLNGLDFSNEGNEISIIPESIGNLEELEFVDFSNTQITTIPAILGDLSELSKIWWENGQLTGYIPPELGNRTNLTGLKLNDNQLTGSIPAELGSTNLHYLYLNRNQLTGEVPLEIWNLEAFYESGDPYEDGGLSLRTINLRHNQLTGVIPESICDLNLRWNHYNFVDIRNNKFCPPYPSCLTGRMGSQNTSDCD